MGKPIMKLEKLYYAEILKDDSTGVEFEKPVYLEGIREYGFKPKLVEGKYYEESKLTINKNTFSEAEIEIDITDIDEEIQCDLLGCKMSEDGGVLYSTADVAKDVCLLIKALDSDNKGIYNIVYKCNFALSDETIKQMEDKMEFQAKKCKIVAMPLKYNGVYNQKLRESSEVTDETVFAKVPAPKEKKTT